MKASKKPEAKAGRTVEAASAPETGAASFPIVGIGASAGGLAAFEAFFSGMPADADPGMAFVLVQHLAPDHKSILSELIQRYTRMQVFEVEDGMVVQPNCAYIIPPNHDMAFLNGTLQLMEPSAPRGQRLPIDFFFRSLAQDQRERAIGVVLSGTGSDGTLGVREIKGNGGMAMAQNPPSTEYDGMPRSAIATGLVDYELPPSEMPAQLIAYAAHAFGKAALVAAPGPKVENALRKAFILLRDLTGHDFSQYKPNTIQRRIERRMAVHQIEALGGYVTYLQQNSSEVDALFRDLLIGVTGFFRDPKVFDRLEARAIPKLFAGKPGGGTIRVWVPGCSTGEEAYGIAILLQERMEEIKQTYVLQIFATDIDCRAIATARAGLYPASIAANLTPERLARFFTMEPDGSAYRIHKSIRDFLVFSEQNVIRDPPFSKLDLISCRNLMIYLGGELQKKLIPLFHYALNPGGILFLGTSETVGQFGNLFGDLDRAGKLYRRKDDFHSTRETVWPRSFPSLGPSVEGLSRAVTRGTSPAKLPLRELTEQALLRQIAPAGALVNNRGDILYLHGRSGMYLEPAPGIAGTNNILKMAREGLRHPLVVALREAVAGKEIVRQPHLRVKTNGDFTAVSLTIRHVNTASPVPHAAAAVPLTEPLYLVILEEALPLDAEQARLAAALTAGTETDGSEPAADGRFAALRQELQAKEDRLQSMNEEMETSNEEMKSSNEEMQSINEELQSTNEEMETSKEELQSVNEELATVNTELETKVRDLSQANNDMSNMLSGNGIGTVCLDRQLRVLRFTPVAMKVVNLIPADVGRPVAHIVSNMIGYDALVADAQAVLDTLVPKELEVQTTDGWYTMRIQPYRTLDNVIEGAVVTFVDATVRKTAEEALRKANDVLRLAVVVRDAYDAITMYDLAGRIMAWNAAAERAYGWSETEALQMNVRDFIPEELRQDALDNQERLAQAADLKPFRTRRIAKDGTVVDAWITATAILDEEGKMYAVTTTERRVGVSSEDLADD